MITTKQENMKAIIAFLLISILIISCTKDEGVNPDNSKEPSEEVIATKEKLVGEWKLINSTVDGNTIGTDDFAYLKESYATFNADDTYIVVYKKKTNNSSSTSTQSGTYTVVGVDSVTFYNSTSEIVLVGEALQITQTTKDNKTQIDTFIRNDNAEFDENEEIDEQEEIDVAEDSTAPEIEDNYDGTDVIAKVMGVWKIEEIYTDCGNKNTLEFKTSNLLEFTRHKKNFNRNDLLRNNISISYPITGMVKVTVTMGNSTVVVDSEADCQLIKTSNLEYIVKDENTILIEGVPYLTIKIIDDNTINMVYKYTDNNSKEQTVENKYIKQ